jgi:poly(hydroxyalkanoate) granule-associated protein
MTTEKTTIEQPAEDKGTLELLQEGISKTSREIWLAGLGVFATLDKEGTNLFNKFVARGRELSESGKATTKGNGEVAPTYVSEKVDQLTHDVVTRVGKAADYVRNKVSGLTERAADTTHDEIKVLTEKVDKLTESVAALVQKLEENAKAGAKKA